MENLSDFKKILFLSSEHVVENIMPLGRALGGGVMGMFKAYIVDYFYEEMVKGSGLIYKGQRWIPNTIEEIAKELGSSYNETQQALEILCKKDKVLIVESLANKLNERSQYNNKTLYYTLDFKQLLEKYKEEGLLNDDLKNAKSMNKGIFYNSKNVRNNDLPKAYFNLSDSPAIDIWHYGTARSSSNGR